MGKSRMSFYFFRSYFFNKMYIFCVLCIAYLHFNYTLLRIILFYNNDDDNNNRFSIAPDGQRRIQASILNFILLYLLDFHVRYTEKWWTG